jgi:hypothetical protein
MRVALVFQASASFDAEWQVAPTVSFAVISGM